MSIQVYGWNDLRMSVAGSAIGQGAPTLTAFGPTGTIKMLAFSVNDSVYLGAHFGHDILQGSVCFPHVHWSTNGTNVNTVKWELSYSVANGHNTAAFPANTVLTLEEAASGTAWQHMITEDPTGFLLPDPDALIVCELKRITNGGTDNTDTVFGLFADIHYRVGQVGTPNRTPDFWT